MPWQSMASLGVIITMFNVVPALNAGVQYLGYGKKKELGLTSNEWNYRMSKRDAAYEQHAARVRAEMDKLRVQKS
ncbi:unnamed protein product [Pseudo-nitzschia multistriata]|uniref:NADH dehydrogenase [ubiquinone] 1 alpha subcomplex subunit 1 n=1 Tax=Pseudo-nitzschia multistriata TaxID=183589 RepID=A0A448ZEA1_9STRA|nr:unnamed protein product [Pseudo-nitzschia multistriata]